MEPLDRGTLDLLERVRRAVRGGDDAGVPTAGPPPSPVALTPAARVEAFRDRFEALGGTFLSAPAPEAAAPRLAELLRAEGVGSLVAPQDDAPARSLATALAPLGFALAEPAAVMTAAPPASAGLQTAQYAVAETGTIVQTSGGNRTLLPGLVTDVHVALLSPSTFVDRMEECLAPLAHDPPRNVSFVTGPSRTADIELTLTVGVHGPRRVVAVLVVPGEVTTPGGGGRGATP